MRLATKIFLVLVALGLTSQAYGMDVLRRLSVEIDPLAPVSAAEETERGNETSMWGGNIDFNLGKVATGPEVWFGTYNRVGVSDEMDGEGPAELSTGESTKVTAMKLKWNITLYERPFVMRGWFFKAGVAYTHIDMRSKRNNEDGFTVNNAVPDSYRSDVGDTRSGINVGFGQRWTFLDNHGTITLGASYTSNFKRSVHTDSVDTGMTKQYNDLIDMPAFARLSTRAMPEAHLGLGYLW